MFPEMPIRNSLWDKVTGVNWKKGNRRFHWDVRTVKHTWSNFNLSSQCSNSFSWTKNLRALLFLAWVWFIHALTFNSVRERFFAAFSMILKSSIKPRDSFSSLSNRSFVELEKLTGFPVVLSSSKEVFPPATRLFFLACISLISCLVSFRLPQSFFVSPTDFPIECENRHIAFLKSHQFKAHQTHPVNDEIIESINGNGRKCISAVYEMRLAKVTYRELRVNLSFPIT